MSLDDLVLVLQVSIGPVILISGVGLLLLSMTNRFGRVTDRCRAICESLRDGGDADRDHHLAQLRVFERRARLIRVAIGFAGTSVLLASLLIIVLFAATLFGLELALVLVVIFVACMATLIASLVLFLRDINISLAALKLEVEAVHGQRS